MASIFMDNYDSHGSKDSIEKSSGGHSNGPIGKSSGGCCDGIQIKQAELNNEFFKRAYDSLCKMQQAKNKKYGNSALKPLEIFSKHHTYGGRIDEKLARIKYSNELRKNDIADIIGGLMLLCQERGWDYFEDLID